MDGTSVAMTTATAMTASQLAPAVGWCLNGFPHPIPDSVPFTIAAGLIVAGHAAYVWLTSRKAVVPAAPAAPAPAGQ